MFTHMLCHFLSCIFEFLLSDFLHLKVIFWLFFLAWFPLKRSFLAFKNWQHNFPSVWVCFPGRSHESSAVSLTKREREIYRRRYKEGERERERGNCVPGERASKRNLRALQSILWRFWLISHRLRQWAKWAASGTATRNTVSRPAIRRADGQLAGPGSRANWQPATPTQVATSRSSCATVLLIQYRSIWAAHHVVKYFRTFAFISLQGAC